MMMQDKIDRVNSIIESKQTVFDDFFLMLNLLYFASFVKNLPILDNEKKNRLQYALEETYKKLDNIDFNKLKLNIPHYELYLDIADDCFQCLGSVNQITFRRKLTTMLTVYFLYREILKFYSKKALWQKSVWIKIDDIIGSCVGDLANLLPKTNEYKDIYRYFDFIDNTLRNNKHVKYVVERQELKSYSNYFNEFSKLNDILFLSDKNDILRLVRNFENKNKNDSKIIGDFLDNMEYIFSPKY
jgi:hypothetical protein